MDALAALARPYQEAFLFAFVRLAAMLTAAPLLGSRSIPVMHRAGLALLLAVVLVPVSGPAAPKADNVVALVLGLIGEALVGTAIGVIAGLAIAAVQGAGETLGFQMGLGLGAVYDPAMGQNAAVVTRLFDVLGMMLFLAVDGHHVMVSAVAASFHRLQPGAVFGGAAVAGGVVALGSKVIRSALEVAAPLVGVLFVVNVVLALLARVAPHLNVFAVGIPLAVGVGLVGLVETMPHALAVTGRLLGEIGGDVHRLITGATHGLR